MQRLGIDAGGTLIKIAVEENGKYHLKMYPLDELESVMSWLKMSAPIAKVALTGGKANQLKKQFLHDAIMVEEFQATCDGARFLLMEEKKELQVPYLLVNIGTGTSWYHIKGSESERILGSGLGGGAYMGLGSLLAKEVGFHQLTEFAAVGNKGKADLLVKDIYEGEEPPIGADLTAANFAKVSKGTPSKEDLISSLSNMIAENIVLLSLQAAAIHHVKDIVYIGSTLSGNSALKNSLESYTEMLSLTPHFLEKGQFCGAYGALLSL
ncbi:type II pantothenate kinase [Neobacillus terrae]|uniref:type II pantothenate kinase n=1 Tax=Neobacillus terrae TaxID=3034837 RepID=UPI001A9CB0AD|nr:type II pantothenate kinase [Neobacillus terrae]